MTRIGFVAATAVAVLLTSPALAGGHGGSSRATSYQPNSGVGTTVGSTFGSNRDHRNGAGGQGGVTVTTGTPPKRPGHGGIGQGYHRGTSGNPRDHRGVR
jgi:hypothetical protein